ncbi:hypothetical protein RZN22_11770 [Bacillaceae bacterium S4-13-58]
MNSLKKIDTYAVKASQFNHLTGEQLSERWNDFGAFLIQRDLCSAFLIRNTKETLHSMGVDLCHEEWERFIEWHNCEIAQLKQSQSNTLRWLIA